MLRQVLVLLVLATLSVTTPASLADSPTNKCSNEAFLRHESFISSSAKLHDLAQSGKVAGQHELAEELFDILSDLKEAAILCGDARLPKLFNDTASFVFLTHKEQRLLELYKHFLRTAPLTREQYIDFSDNLYLMHWQAREFKMLDSLKHEFPISLKTTEFYPDTFQHSINEEDMLLKAKFTANREIKVLSEKFSTNDLQVVVVVAMLDGGSRRVFNALQTNPNLFDAKDSLLFLFSQSSRANFLDLANVSEVIAGFNFALVNNEDSWPKEMYFHRYPVFYFIHNNKVLDHIIGWPSEEQAKVVNDTYQRLKDQLEK